MKEGVGGELCWRGPKGVYRSTMISGLLMNRGEGSTTTREETGKIYHSTRSEVVPVPHHRQQSRGQ